MQLIRTVWSQRADRGAEERLGVAAREPLIPLAALKKDAHLEMHTRGGYSSDSGSGLGLGFDRIRRCQSKRLDVTNRRRERSERWLRVGLGPTRRCGVGPRHAN